MDLNILYYMKRSVPQTQVSARKRLLPRHVSAALGTTPFVCINARLEW